MRILSVNWPYRYLPRWCTARQKNLGLSSIRKRPNCTLYHWRFFFAIVQHELVPCFSLFDHFAPLYVSPLRFISYNLTLSVADDLPFLIQHLGPRYVAHFQTKHLVRFLTYEAATSLNIHLSNDAVSGTGKYHKSLPSPPRLPLISAIKDGMGIGEESFYFSLSTNGLVTKINPETGFDDIYVQSGAAGSKSTSRTKIEIHGTVTPVKNECLDIALWRIGGPSVALRIVELASV